MPLDVSDTTSVTTVLASRTTDRVRPNRSWLDARILTSYSLPFAILRAKKPPEA